MLSEATSGLTLGFQVDYLLSGCITAVTYAERLTCSRDITVHKRSRGAQSADHERSSEEEERPLKIFLTIFIRRIYLCELLKLSAAENE